MNVFAVWSGEYSDKMVEGIFSTREKAQTWIDDQRRVKFYSYSDNFYIKEYNVDSSVMYDDKIKFKVYFDVIDGDYKYSWSMVECENTIVPFTHGNIETIEDTYYCIDVEAVNINVAIQIALDMMYKHKYNL